MEPFFDIDKLHKRQRRQKIRNMTIGVLACALVGRLIVADLAVRRQNNVRTLLAEDKSLVSIGSGKTITPSPPENIQSSTSAIDSLNQQEAQAQAKANQEQVIANQDAAIAEQDLNKAANTPISFPSYSTNNYTPPSQPTVVSAPTTSLSVYTSSNGTLNGKYYYAVSYEQSNGTETALGPVSLSVTPDDKEVWLTNIPISSDSSVTARNIYRTLANGSMVGPFYLMTTISNNSSTTYYDNNPDNSLPTYAPKYQ